MTVRRFSNGDLLVPVGGEDANGVLWDGRQIVLAGTNEHALWERHLRDAGEVTEPIPTEFESTERAQALPPA